MSDGKVEKRDNEVPILKVAYEAWLLALNSVPNEMVKEKKEIQEFVDDVKEFGLVIPKTIDVFGQIVDDGKKFTMHTDISGVVVERYGKAYIELEDDNCESS